ncbi:MAG: hypothetical protein IPF58_18050 [Saprospirales bacterium]|nr:hypothetical protein [Saprospirales bacterium]
MSCWVCDLGSSLLGLQRFPQIKLHFHPVDGVVISYQYFGLSGTIGGTNNLNRTATLKSDIGWIYIIFGTKADCDADDEVTDTPNKLVEIILVNSKSKLCNR